MSSSCCICLDTNREPFVSQCDHSFCNKCILEWITQNDDCPLCRTAISAPSKNTIVYEEDEEIENRFQLYVDGNISAQETTLVHDRVDDFISSFEDDDSESKYNWKDNVYGSYLVIRNGDYFLDLCFQIHTHRDIRNCYIIIAKVSKRHMVKPKAKQNKKFNTIKTHKTHQKRNTYFRK
jgi:hypothetical protein